MTNVLAFPNTLVADPPQASELAAAMTRPLLTAEQLLTVDLDVITEPGPLVAQGTLVDVALRITAIGQALAGPGRVQLTDAAEALRVLIDELDPHERTTQ